MKRLVVALGLALLLSLVVGVEVASATHSEGEGPKQSFAQGTAKFELPDGAALLHVNAKDELDPRGHFFLREEETVQDAWTTEIEKE